MNILQGYNEWSELDLLTGCIFGESRGEPLSGKIGVGLTVMTRAQNPGWWGRNVREVLLAELKPGKPQFDCWIDEKDLIEKAYQQKGIIWQQCAAVAHDVYAGQIQDSIGKPTHYHSVACHPDWVASMVKLATIGRHIFYHDPAIDKKVKRSIDKNPHGN